MNILILGAGQVGSTVARYLVQDGHDITIVDTDAKKLADIRKHTDLNTVVGSGTNLDVLQEAGVEDIDMLIAVMSHDEYNVMACRIAHSLYQTEAKIARVRNSSLTQNDIYKKIFNKKSKSIDAILTPESLVTGHIKDLLKFPGALQIVNFEKGILKIVVVRIHANSPLCGIMLRDIKNHVLENDIRIVTIYRRGTSIMPDANTLLQEDDEIFCIVKGEKMQEIMPQLVGERKKNKRIVIAGGGNIGYHLARAIEGSYNVKLIELDHKRGAFLNGHLKSTIILQGSANDIELLKDENIGDCDVFIAAMNSDSNNVLAALLAKRFGATQVKAILNEPMLLETLEGKFIDTVITPSRETTSHLLTYVRSGDTVQAYALRHGAAEMIEMVVHGNGQTSNLVGRSIKDLKLPKGSGIGAIIRDTEGEQRVMIARSNMIVQDLDRLIIITIDRQNLKQIEKLFQAPIGFF